MEDKRFLNSDPMVLDEKWTTREGPSTQQDQVDELGAEIKDLERLVEEGNRLYGLPPVWEMD